jgi:hypothetical protein
MLAWRPGMRAAMSKYLCDTGQLRRLTDSLLVRGLFEQPQPQPMATAQAIVPEEIKDEVGDSWKEDTAVIDKYNEDAQMQVILCRCYGYVCFLFRRICTCLSMMRRCRRRRLLAVGCL